MADNENLIALTAGIVASFVGNNKVAVNEVGELVATIHSALSQTANPVAVESAPQEPAVSIRSSVKNDYIVCLEDGKKLKMLKRYLRSNYNLSPDEYRAKWGLARDYPMVAPAYAETRRGLAHAIGLGRRAGSVVVDTVEGAEGAEDTVPETVSETVEPKAAGKRGRPAGSKNTKSVGTAKRKAGKVAKVAKVAEVETAPEGDTSDV